MEQKLIVKFAEILGKPAFETLLPSGVREVYEDADELPTEVSSQDFG